MNDKRKVSKQVVADFGLTAVEVAYWDRLGIGEQETFYAGALNDIRSAVYWENIYGKLAQRGQHGRGVVLAEAVQAAYLTSPEHRAKVHATVAAKREARDNELHECVECHETKPAKRSLVCGDVAVCFDCAKQGPMAALLPKSEREAV